MLIQTRGGGGGCSTPVDSFQELILKNLATPPALPPFFFTGLSSSSFFALGLGLIAKVFVLLAGLALLLR
jgi:hypothetical protein